MASIVISGDTSGAVTLAAPAVAGTNTLTLPAQTATVATLTTPSFATTIGVGGATAAASGAGISFPATQSASSDANTLDDYEEGDFTPTVVGSSTAGTATYDTRYARYTKIGRVVYIEILLQWSSGTGSGNLKFGNLPFTCANAVTYPSLSIGYFNNVALSSGNIATAFVGSNEAAIYFYQTPTGGGASTTVPYDAAGYIQIAGCYTV